MFGFSLGEFIIVAAVALLLLSPQELLALIKSTKKLLSQAEEYYKSYLDYFNQAVEGLEKDELMDYIIDLDGNLQKTYDLSQIKPELKCNNDESNIS